MHKHNCVYEADENSNFTMETKLNRLVLKFGAHYLAKVFLFFLAKAALAYLPTASPLLVSATLTSLPFLFSYLILVLSVPPCPLLHLFFYLKLSGRSGRNCFLSPPVLSGYNGSPDTRFSWGTTRLMRWRDGERCLRPLQSFAVSLLLSLVSTLLFSRAGGVLSHQNSLTHRFPPKNLSSLVMLAVFSLVYAATNTAFC